MLVPLVPWGIVRLLGAAETVKSGGGVTISVIVVEFVKLPEMPLMVTGNDPMVAVALAVSVNVLVAVAGFWLNDAVTPPGNPDADKLTPAPKPFCGLTVIVLVPWVPCAMLRLAGDPDNV